MVEHTHGKGGVPGSIPGSSLFVDYLIKKEMATKSPRVIIGLKCDVCSEINHTSTKNPQNSKESVKLNKFCPKCKKHTPHTEVKLGK